jgi:hypothetical protein
MKRLFKFNDFLNESSGRLSYAAFDWDDNVVLMPTKIHMEHLVDNKWIPQDVSTSEFAIVRKEIDSWRVPSNAYSEFRDWGSHGEDTFLEDTKSAINSGLYGPSWRRFIRELVSGRIFAIITSRGHSPNNLRKAVEYIIYEVLDADQQDEMLQNLMEYKEMFNEDFDYLVDEYLDNCVFIGITSKWFEDNFDKSLNSEQRKEVGFEYFVNKLNEYGKKVDKDVVVGFSDDDPAFADAVKNFMGELKLKYAMDYYVYYTKDPKNIKKVKA